MIECQIKDDYEGPCTNVKKQAKKQNNEKVDEHQGSAFSPFSVFCSCGQRYKSDTK